MCSDLLDLRSTSVCLKYRDPIWVIPDDIGTLLLDGKGSVLSYFYAFCWFIGAGVPTLGHVCSFGEGLATFDFPALLHSLSF